VKRGQSGLSCLVALDKPAQMTSHDVVNRVRKIAGERRVGHAGTLDPAATGLLCIGIGPATRLLPYLTGHSKRYHARIIFGVSTDTDDADGCAIEHKAIPSEVGDVVYAEDILKGFLGMQQQAPPCYSAIKKNGMTAYAAARKGEALELEPRSITVYEARLRSVPKETDIAWDVEFYVSKGTYIRALARDIGRACGTVAHLGLLRRIGAGNLGIGQASTIETLESDGVAACIIDPVEALGYDALALEESLIVSLEQGKQLRAPSGTADGIVALTVADRLRSIHCCKRGLLVPKTVIIGGVSGVGLAMIRR
jgi:tRNA pseudouridine55 synthase